MGKVGGKDGFLKRGCGVSCKQGCGVAEMRWHVVEAGEGSRYGDAESAVVELSIVCPVSQQGISYATWVLHCDLTSQSPLYDPSQSYKGHRKQLCIYFFTAFIPNSAPEIRGGLKRPWYGHV